MAQVSDVLTEVVSKELDRIGAELASYRMSAGDTRLWAIATLTEAAYCLRAVRAAGLLTAYDVSMLMIDAADVAFSEPANPVKIVQSVGKTDTEGKPN